ncbi:WD40-repeat-containing domain protein [Peziza echinospora]|nr:WD40-repeat-containing domain protein [Peziza echinospora]
MAKKKSRSAGQAIADAAKALSLTAKAGAPPPLPKDEEELRLEKLVFGDLTGFEEGLKEGLFDNLDREQRRLENLAAGNSDGEESDAGLHIANSKGADLEAVNDDELFQLDFGVPSAAAPDAMDHDGDVVDLTTEDAEPTGPPPAWIDSDDERVTISLTSQNRLKKYRETFTDDVVTGSDYIRRLRQQYERVYPVPKWALPQDDPQESKRRRRNSDSDSDSASSSSGGEDGDIDAPTSAAPLSSLLQSSEGYISKPENTTSLRPSTINISRLRDANHLAPSHSSIGTLSFHPKNPLLMTSGLDHTMRLYHIDGKNNPPVTSLYLKNTPIHTSVFHPDGTRVFAAGRRKYFHIWDLETGAVEKITRVYGHQNELRSMEHFKISPDGKFMAIASARGLVNILSTTTSQWIASAKVDGVIADLAWYSPAASASPGLTIANTHGELWEYDLTAANFSTRWLDEGGVNTTKIALGGPGDKYVAVGSNCGVVNVYDRKGVVGASTGSAGKPIRALGQLVTRIDSLEFSGDGQVLCMASGAKKDALRLVHLPTCTVYQNWPTTATPLGRITSVAFTPGNTSMFSAGNEAGKVRLWEIRP